MIDYAALQALNPSLIYCSISGFGRNGPLEDAKGYDVILQAFSGIMGITGHEGAEPGCSPISPIDQTTGMHASGRDRLKSAHRMIIAIASIEKPVIAAVRGPVAGIGWSMALACDMIRKPHFRAWRRRIDVSVHYSEDHPHFWRSYIFESPAIKRQRAAML